MAHLLLVRHGKSTWNAKGQWTGWTDVGLSEEGVAEAERAGEALRDIEIHKAYVSDMKRAQETLDHIKATLGREIETIVAPELKERHYGIYTGKNKWQVQKEVGEEEFTKIRRAYDHPIPEGESLKDVYARVVPYFEKRILPDLKAGKNVLVSSHGNSLRALMKYLDKVSDEGVANLEIGTGEIHCYAFDTAGNVTGKEIRAANPKKV